MSENLTANLFYTYEEQRAQSAGISYSAGQITNTANVGASPATPWCRAAASARSSKRT